MEGFSEIFIFDKVIPILVLISGIFMLNHAITQYRKTQGAQCYHFLKEHLKRFNLVLLSTLYVQMADHLYLFGRQRLYHTMKSI